MAHRDSVRQIVRAYQKGLNDLQREVGDNIVLFEFDEALSTKDDIYDEGPIPDIFDPGLQRTGPGRVYRSPQVIPAIWIRFEPPAQVATDEGEYTVNSVSFRASTQTMRRVGLQAPLDPSQHYNDRFSYNGYLYRVTTWAPKGWLYGQYLMVDILGTEVKSEELAEDKFPFDADGVSPAWTPGQALDWPATQAQDWTNVDDGTGSVR